MQGPSPQEPEPPAGFRWPAAYRSIKLRWDSGAQRGDAYAVAAYSGAVRDIDQALRDAYMEHLKVKFESQEPGPETMEYKLRRLSYSARHDKQLARLEALGRSLNGIYRLTHAKVTELELRSDELSAASHSYPAAVPGRQAVEQWLRGQAEAVHEWEVERSYFTQLAQEVALGLDPWTVSRRLVGSLPEPGNADQAARLRAAHGRLVQAMAGPVSPQAAPSDPGGTVLPEGFRWLTTYNRILTRWGEDRLRKDACAAAASAGAIREIDEAVTDADNSHRRRRVPPGVRPTPEKLIGLQDMRRNTKYRNQTERADAIARSLDRIYLLIHERDAELTHRSAELSAASPAQPAAVPDRPALGQWLRGQADAAHESEAERSYFTQLAQELAQGLDPWTVSRRLVGRLPEPGNVDRTAVLKAAHGRLVQAMAGSPQQPQAPPRPGSPAAAGPMPHESRAPASRRQEIVQRLRGGNRLSEAQVEAIRSAVAAAADTGTLGASGARPVASAMGLLERIQQSVEKPIAEFTEAERRRLSSDWQRFGELLEGLERAGHL